MKELFEIELRVKDQNEKIITLAKKVELEMKNDEVVVPQEVVFKKDSQKFRVIIEKLELRYGLFKRRVGSYTYDVPSDASYQIYLGEPGPGPIKETNVESQHYVRIVNPWIKSNVLFAFLILLFFIVIFSLLWWEKYRRKKLLKSG